MSDSRLRRFGLLLVCGWGVFSVYAPAGAVRMGPGEKAKRPALIVLLGVDQLLADILDRYDSALTGGFRRLKTKGLRFVNTFVDHAPTTSMPGHATIATGMFPSHHGILEGSWGEVVDGKLTMTSSVQDKAYRIVGYPDA